MTRRQGGPGGCRVRPPGSPKVGAAPGGAPAPPGRSAASGGSVAGGRAPLAAPIHRRRPDPAIRATTTRERSSGQSSEEPPHVSPVVLGHASHHEDGGGGEVGLPRASSARRSDGHFGVLHQPELVLQRGQLADVAVGAPAVELAGELERVAQALAADAQAVEVRHDAGALGPPRRLRDGVMPRVHEIGHGQDGGEAGGDRPPHRSLLHHGRRGR